MGAQTKRRVLLSSTVVAVATCGVCLALIMLGMLYAGLGINRAQAHAVHLIASFPGEYVCAVTGTAVRFQYGWTAAFWGLVAGTGWGMRQCLGAPRSR